jgi:hypothetical protein
MWIARSSSRSFAHRLKVLKRKVGRPRLRRRDLLLMAALGGLLAPCSVVVVLGRPADPPSVAPGTGEAEVDLQTDLRRRPPMSEKVRHLIRRDEKGEPQGDASGSGGELLNLGIRVSGPARSARTSRVAERCSLQSIRERSTSQLRSAVAHQGSPPPAGPARVGQGRKEVWQ